MQYTPAETHTQNHMVEDIALAWLLTWDLAVRFTSQDHHPGSKSNSLWH